MGATTGSSTTDVRKPKEFPPRDRRVTQDEIEKICLVLGFDDEPVRTKNQAVAVAFLFAIETAKRAGEIGGILAEHIPDRVAHLPFTKNGTKRDMPLSSRAITLLSYLPEPTSPANPIFMLGTESLAPGYSTKDTDVAHFTPPAWKLPGTCRTACPPETSVQPTAQTTIFSC